MTQQPKLALISFATTLGGACLGLYVLLGALLYFQQARLIFRPVKEIAKIPQNYQEVFIPVQTKDDRMEKIYGWWLPSENTQTQKRVLLYFHGCCNNISQDIDKIKAWQKLGFSILAIDYRGYGKSEGSFPSESQVYADAKAAWDYLRSDQQIKPEQIIIYGSSLGGAIAIELATKHPDAMGLIVESSFSSMREMIGERPIPPIYPFDLILHQKFNSIVKIKKLNMAILFLHGTKDTIVPFRMSKQLYQAAKENKQITLIPGGGHLDAAMSSHQLYWKSIIDFISRLGTRG
jgi:uncharacterized protein